MPRVLHHLKPIGSTWTWRPTRAGYHPSCGVETVTVVGYPSEDAPHHQSPTGRYEYLVRGRLDVKMFATDESLEALR